MLFLPLERGSPPAYIGARWLGEVPWFHTGPDRPSASPEFPTCTSAAPNPRGRLFSLLAEGEEDRRMFEYLTLAPHRQWVWETVTITEEHVPDSQDWSPGKGPGKGTHKPFGHVEDWVDLVFLQMAVGYGGDATQQSKQDLSIELYSFLKSDTGKKEWTKGTKEPLFAFVRAEIWFAAWSVKHKSECNMCGFAVFWGKTAQKHLK